VVAFYRKNIKGTRKHFRNNFSMSHATIDIHLTVEYLKLELAQASQLAAVDGQEVKVYETPEVPMCFDGAMCQFYHRMYPCFGSLESMVEVSARKLHCHQLRDFVASKISSQLNNSIVGKNI
jgi:hypothetical protein